MSAQGSDRSRLFYAQHGRCFYCGDEMILDGNHGTRRPGQRDYICTIDHLIPKALGGDSSLLNKIASCAACNRNKGDRYPTDGELSRARQYQGLAMSKTRKTLKREMEMRNDQHTQQQP